MERPKKIQKDIQPYIEHLEERVKKFESSPYVETYLTIHNQLSDFNKQLTITGQTVVNSEGVKEKKGKIDLFADKDDKSFDRMKWYFDKILDLNKNLDELRKMMTPDEVEDIKSKVTKVGGVEEYLNLGGKK